MAGGQVSVSGDYEISTRDGPQRDATFSVFSAFASATSASAAMSLARLGLFCRPCSRTTTLAAALNATRPLIVGLEQSSSRQFSSTPAVLLRKAPKVRPPLSKKAAAAKARRKAAKAPKHIYANEKMSLTDAIAVLRVSDPRTSSHSCHLG
jgi:hypothetical protein